MFWKTVIIGSVATMTFSAASPALAQTFHNGSFEDNASSSDYALYTVGSFAIPYWQVITTNKSNSPTVALDKNGAFTVTASNGLYSVDLTGGGPGYNDYNGNGLTQTFDTVAGHTYSLSFDVGSNINYTGAAGATITAFINGVSVLPVSNPRPLTSTQTWLTGTTTFVASGNSTKLDLIESAGDLYAGLDNIKVADLGGPVIPGGVPDPASWAMMIGGFGAVGGVLRRRRRETVRLVAV